VTDRCIGQTESPLDKVLFRAPHVTLSRPIRGALSRARERPVDDAKAKSHALISSAIGRIYATGRK
jgi:hypothetical protein